MYAFVVAKPLAAYDLVILQIIRHGIWKMPGLDAKYDMLVTPYRGASGIQCNANFGRKEYYEIIDMRFF